MQQHILLIDDDDDEFFIFKELIEDSDEDCVLEWCNTYEKGKAAMLKGDKDLYVIDYFLGAKNGLDLFKEVKEKGFQKPAILLTGQGNKEVDNAALKAGMADYLTKSTLSGDVLGRTIRFTAERHKAQENIRAERWRYNMLFEDSMDPIILCANNFEVKECNRAFKDIIGREFDLGETICVKDFVVSDSASTKFEKEIKSNRSVKDYEIKLDSTKGEIVCLASVSAISKEEGEKEGYQIIFHDMTQIRAAEKEIRVAEQISFAGKLAQLIAHEVRNPLTNINLAVDQFSELEHPTQDDKSLYFAMIKRNSNRINDLISQILDSSKPAEIRMVKQNVEAIINGCVKLCHDRINLNDIELIKSFDSRPKDICLDAEKMSLALVNIITNAIEAMAGIESPQLTLSTLYTDLGVAIIIEDNGKGMSVEQQNKVFEPFYSGRRGGKGLGMTLTKNVVSAHNGSIVVQSTLDVGTQFYVFIPEKDT